MDKTDDSKPSRLTIENLVLARCHAELGPLEPAGTEGATRAHGRFGAHAFQVEVHPGGEAVGLRFADGASSHVERLSLVDALFARFPGARAIEVAAGTSTTTHRRHSFYQVPDLWHHRGDRYPLPHSYTETKGIRHPERTKPTDRVLFKRHCAQANITFEVRNFDLDEHFDLFHRWMNDPEVAVFWEMAFSREKLREYILEKFADPHMLPAIGYFDGEPFAYFEMYWSKEDRLGPHYEADDYDRGFHMAVGESRYRFQGLGRVWFLSMAHLLYLDEPRTMRLVGEPRVDQVRVKNWAKSTPWEIVKEFDFPHKRAVLMMMSRDRFFGSFQL
ncbi:GNAT family N-acetyltransferase [Chondromyces crocatus]|uniref:Acyltransferase MbtK/IucB-like conserved domain-containing protein n=1 Tax=Chondromyces crocatus TaxID=52 RepID=A0A0K1ECA9_CHOCO|nr:GNAT family N-acetyltransferase [Chondromyces crocatus]AKT38198.1 uncharacterized protein CMC5_023410 [Chondromyces crocatus]